MVVHIKFFGALKRFSINGITIDVSPTATIEEIRELIKKHLLKSFPDDFNEELINRAALADETNVLQRETVLGSRSTLALLPPVCGG